MKKLITLLLVLTGMVSTASADVNTMYIVGDTPYFGDWKTNYGELMTDNGDGTFSYRFTASTTGNIYFCFASSLVSGESEWTSFDTNAYRPSDTNEKGVGENSLYSKVANKGEGSESFSMYLKSGHDYVLNFDETNRKIWLFQPIYILGTLNGNSWGPNIGIEMENHVSFFTANVEAQSENTLFNFTNKLTASWDDINNNNEYRFGANYSSDGDYSLTESEYTDGTPLSTAWWGSGTKSYTVPKGWYTINVDVSGTYTVSIQKVEKVTTNAYGYCTFVNTNPLTITGATAYYATDNGNGSATAVKMTNPAASTPMLIAGENSTTYYFAVAATGADDPGSSNAFQEGDGTAPGSGNDTDGYNYILNNDAFYLAADRTVPSTKAYLHLSQKAAARALIFDDEATGINAIVNEETTDQYYYNLSGLRIVSPAKGLYIRDGKKVIVK